MHEKVTSIRIVLTINYLVVVVYDVLDLSFLLVILMYLWFLTFVLSLCTEEAFISCIVFHAKGRIMLFFAVAVLPKPAQPMEFVADIVFIVDSSSGVSRQNYNKEKAFIKSLAKTLNLSPGKTRASVVVYSGVASLEIRFSAYYNSTIFDKAVDDLPYLGSVRRMDLGLREGAVAMKDARPNVRRVVVLLTTGRQSQSSNLLPQAVRPLEELSANIYVVAIGSQPNDQELRLVVKAPGDVLKVSRFDDLTPQTRPIARHIVNKTGKTTSFTCLT